MGEVQAPTAAVASAVPYFRQVSRDGAEEEATDLLPDDVDSTCSTPYVSAPSSPGRGPPHCGGGFYYSAPASPMHFVLSTSNMCSSTSVHSDSAAGSSSFEFDFSARLAADGDACAGSMSSADELFFNGQIRPMKLSTHLQRPQILAPLLDLDESEEADLDRGDERRGRGPNFRNRSLRRRTRSMSPLRTASFQWHEEIIDIDDEQSKSKNPEQNEIEIEIEIKEENRGESNSNETTPCDSASSSRSSSIGRSSKRWVLLKELLYRSKSEGRKDTHKFWGALAFSSPIKEKKAGSPSTKSPPPPPPSNGETPDVKKPKARKKPVNGNSPRVPPSPHELHYTANRAQAEEMRRKTYLPYRQGLLGCLGFSSKSYGAMNGLAKALNPVSSR
ncbi:hypothetical protein DM860_007436 [Cuscuta australis]|uniref:Calmodulin-binding protein n=1 Tax=Cuscuta australis TaxID=267555 RepID=A0A328E7N9_9ASTE|nr:hypothetical protein DM860_007436 [Cuscuta australis]